MAGRHDFRSRLNAIPRAGLGCVLIFSCALAMAAPVLAADDPAPAKAAEVKRGAKGGREKSPIEMSRQEALWTALAFEDVDELKKLIASGGDMNVTDRLSLMTPLMAVETHALALALLDAGADPKARDRDGRTVLHYAVRMREAGSIVPLLISRGADPNARANDGLGSTPIIAAIAAYLEDRDKTRAIASITSLVKAGADPNLPDQKGELPLAKAEASGDKSLAKLLAGLGARRTSSILVSGFSAS